jgi:uncharacterized membrane protein
LTPAVPLFIDALCGIGLVAAAFMQAKTKRYERGEESGPSVVQQPRARLFGGIPNSMFGIAFYALMLIAAWFLNNPVVWYAALAAAAAAAAVSAYLAYSLLFLTRMRCPYCWTGHIVNWTLLAVLIAVRAR